MKITESKKEEFEALVKPLIKFMAQEMHPHHLLVIDSTKAELLEGSISIVTKEFLQD